MLHPPTGSAYVWTVNVEAGTQLSFFMIDSQGRQGGVSPLYTVLNSTDASCLIGNSASPTASVPSPVPSQSTSPVSNTTTVDITIGVTIGGVILVVLLSILYKRGRRTTNPPSQITNVSRSSVRR